MISSLELARRCGVSQGTVDRVLHGRGGVSASTRARVEAAAREHGYLPNPVARELLCRRSVVVGALIPCANALFFMDFVRALKEVTAPVGLRLSIAPVADRAEFLETLEDFAARRVAGVLAVPPEEGIEVPAHLERALPIATFLSPTANPSIPLFAPDERLTGQDAVVYLAGLGHRRILHVTYPRAAHGIAERRTGYCDEMTRRGLIPQVCVFNQPDDLRAAMALFEPTALFCHNDWLALAAMRVLESDRIDVPGDVSVLGVDNSPSFGEFQDDITTLAYPTLEVCHMAMRWLTQGIDERPVSRLRLVEKRSVGPRPQAGQNALNPDCS